MILVLDLAALPGHLYLERDPVQMFLDFFVFLNINPGRWLRGASFKR
jgi:hypothetical protein